VYHVRHATAGGAADADVIAGALTYVEAIMANLTTKIANEVSLVEVEVYEYEVLTGWGPVGTIAGAWAGTGSLDPLPAGCACIMEAYKSRSGYADRKFIMGITEDQAVGNTWVAGLLTAVEAAADDWVADFDDATVQFEPGSWNRTTHTHTLYNKNVAVSPLVAYQRRRKPGVGLT